MNKINAKDFYFDWWNNYLTVARIASDYAIREDQAIELIEQGRIEWNRAADEEKRKATEGDQ